MTIELFLQKSIQQEIQPVVNSHLMCFSDPNIFFSSVESIGYSKVGSLLT